MYLSDDAPLGPPGLLYALFFPADSTELQSCIACFDLGIEAGVKGSMPWSLTVGPQGVKALLLGVCKHAVSIGSSLAETLREGSGVAASARGAADESGSSVASVEASAPAAADPAGRSEEVVGA